MGSSTCNLSIRRNMLLAPSYVESAQPSCDGLLVCLLALCKKWASVEAPLASKECERALACPGVALSQRCCNAMISTKNSIIGKEHAYSQLRSSREADDF